MNLILLLASYVFLIFFFYSIGFSFNKYLSKHQNNFILRKEDYYLCPIIGLSIFSIVVTFLYNVLNLNLLSINFFFLIFLIISIYFNSKSALIYFKKILFFSIPIIIFLIFIIILRDENFFVFRGNYWDQFTILSMALIFEDNRYSDIELLLKLENFDLENFQSFYDDLNKNNLSKDHYYFSFQNIYTRQFNSLLLAFFFIFKFLDPFQINLLIKLFFLTNIVFANIYFFKNFFKKDKKYFFLYSWLFILSFWNIYIFEIDAAAQLCAFSIFIFLLILIKKIIYKNLLSNQHLILFIILLSSLFLIYPTLFMFFSFILFVILLFEYQFFIKNFKNFLIFFLLFILLVSPRLIDSVFLIFSNHSSSPDYWMYFGSFVFGRETVINNPELLSQLKLNLSSALEIKEKILLITKYHLINNYDFVLLNIPLSLFGFYHLTPTFFDGSALQLSLLILSVILVVIIFINIKKNLEFLLINKKKFKFEIVFIFSALLFVFYLIITSKFYGLVKVYFFISPVLFIIFYTNLNNRVLLRNLIIFIFIITIPFYKYSDNNYGIGRADSMPSILDQNKKINVIWSLKNADFANLAEKCFNSFKIDNDDIIERGYLSIKIDYFNFKEDNNSNCIIKKNKKNFIIINEKN